MSALGHKQPLSIISGERLLSGQKRPPGNYLISARIILFRCYLLEGETFSVEFDEKHRTARVVTADGSEIPTITAFWFAWYAFHPETDVYEAE